MAQITLPLATKQTLNAAMERLFRSVGLPENSLGFDFAAQIDANSSNTTFTSTAANGVDAFNVTTNGARFHLGTGTSDYLYSDGSYINTPTRIQAGSFATPTGSFYGNYLNTYSNASLQLISQVPDSFSAVSILLNNTIPLATAGAKIVSVQNNGVEKAFIDKDGRILASGGSTVLGGGMQYQGGAAVFSTNSGNGAFIAGNNGDGPSSVGVILDNAASLVTAGAKLVSIRNAGTEKASFDLNGVLKNPGVTMTTLGNSLNLDPGGTQPISGSAAGLVAGSNWLPSVANSKTLGSATYPWGNTWVTNLNIGGTIAIPTGGAASVAGSATLVAGVVTVNTTSVTASSKIFMEHEGTGVVANFGTLYKGTVVAGTSFQIKSTNASDTDSVSWFIIN